MFPYVVGESRYGYVSFGYVSQKNRENAINNSKLANSKKIRCIEDDKRFDSIRDCAKFYNYSDSWLVASVRRNKTLTCKTTGRKLTFEFI